MSKFLAFLSYGVNAGVMLVVTLLLATTLTAAEYSRYSFAVAAAQTLAVCVFEWLRMAATRYYPGPDPNNTDRVRKALLGGQYFISCCVVVAMIPAVVISTNPLWFLIAAYAVLQGLVDLQFTMLRFDAKLTLFSKLQTLRGILLLALAVSAAFLFRQASAALLGGMLANVFTMGVLAIFQPTLLLVAPSRSHISTLRQMAHYGVSAAAAGGIYQIGPFLLRCVAFRGASDASYAGFSLVIDLMQRPYNVALNALNGVFLPDAMREHDRHDRHSNSERFALQRLYSIQVWCLLLIFGCAIAFQNELLPLLVKPDFLPFVQAVFPYLAVFFLIHAAIQTTSALSLHLQRAGTRLILQATVELVCVATMTGLWMTAVGPGIVPVACGGMRGAIVGFLFTLFSWAEVPCRLPWKSWSVALLTTTLLVLIGQMELADRFTGLILKVLVAGPIVLVGGAIGLMITKGLSAMNSETAKRGSSIQRPQWREDLEANSQQRGRLAPLIAWFIDPGFVCVSLIRCATMPRTNLFRKIAARWAARMLVYKFGCYIAVDAKFGRRLVLPHPVGIVIGENCVIGDDVTIYQHVTLGRRSSDISEYPHIQDGTVIYAGAVVLGEVDIGPHAVVGANAVVLSSIPPNTSAVGVPARVIGSRYADDVESAEALSATS